MKARKLHTASRRKPHFYFHKGTWCVEPVLQMYPGVMPPMIFDDVSRNNDAFLYLIKLNLRRVNASGQITIKGQHK